MLPSMNIDKIIYEYDQLLIRDLGFRDWRAWEPMINEVMNTLGITSLGNTTLKEAHINPGEEITKALIMEWINEKTSGKYWRDLVYLKFSIKSTPYQDYLEYQIYVKTLDEILNGMSGKEVYNNYENLRKLVMSDEYKTLRKLHGVKVTIDK